MQPHIVIEAILPCVDGGRYAVKRIVGDRVVVEADIFRDGHDHVRAALGWRLTGGRDLGRATMTPVGNDRYRGAFVVAQSARHEFFIEAWTDRYGTWLEELQKKVDAGVDVSSELLEGIELIEEAHAAAEGGVAGDLEDGLVQLRSLRKDPKVALSVAAGAPLKAAMDAASPRHDRVVSQAVPLVVDRPRALFSAWYEMFPRSQGTVPGKASTLREAEARLPDIREMGFDVVYLPPVHPIGTTHRKGPNNALVCEPEDPGCPWAIGGAAGGHTAVDPTLGSLVDFDHFVAATRAHGMEVALDFAIQCSPDHPWVKEHPEWFYKRPDGTLKVAENPPKKYEDVHPVNFDTAEREALWQALYDVVAFWIGRDVKIFRVDNPHTKPFDFWKWLIDRVQADHPDVIFLAEAFTRPKVMKVLAKCGFTQSYTYFTWRHVKQELIEYLTELSSSGMQDYYRPNFFANTPDILPPILQTGGRPAFRMRLVLAATLSPSYGIYSGFELCENEALPGREEYLNSEKYEIRVRDWNAPCNIKPLVAVLNAARRSNPALQELDNVRFLPSDDDSVLFFGKKTGHNVILVAVNLDPLATRETMVRVPADYVGIHPGGRFKVTDLITGATFDWGEHNYVRLDPHVEPAHVLKVDRTTSP